MPVKLFKTLHHSFKPLGIGLFGLLFIAGFIAINVLPAIGAQGADVLRPIIGDQAVAQLETIVFQAQDVIHQWGYQLGVAAPTAPWASTPQGTPAGMHALPDVSTQPSAAEPLPASRQTQSGIAPGATSSPAPTDAMPPQSQMTPATIATAAPTAIRTWALAPLSSLGNLAGEGQWLSYLKDTRGRTVAYRTFMQPDPQRTYAVAAIVAFDLNATRLGFVLGTSEPRSDVKLDRPGRIPVIDLQSGRLLAVFNGGFKFRHGHFGAMSNGIIVVPARDGLGTVALYGDGQVRLGAWGTDISPSPDMVAWRQNGPLIIHNGQINPHIADTAPQDWGYTLNGATAVWRSGLGISGDGRTLYYAAGPNLTISALSQALARAGVYEAIQLDINNYWVHFVSVQANHSQFSAVPLLDAMNQNVDRFLYGYSRDFFYIVAKAR